MSPVAVQTEPKMPWQYRGPTLPNAMFNMVYYLFIYAWFKYVASTPKSLLDHSSSVFVKHRAIDKPNSLNCFVERALQKTWSDNVKHIFQKYDVQPRSHTI